MDIKITKIPVEAAKKIADEYGQDQVIICSWDGPLKLVHVVTYGRSIQDSDNAAKGGDFVKKALGWPDRLCNALPPRVLNLVDALKAAVELLKTWHNIHCSVLREYRLPESEQGKAWEIYYNHAPEMKVIRDALALVKDAA